MKGNCLEATELVVRTIAEAAVANEKYFAELDGAVGDGDFGISLATGFTKVLDEWTSLNRTNPGSMLKAVSMVIASRVGGVSGALWGTAFLRAGVVAGDKQDLTPDDVIAMLAAATETSARSLFATFRNSRGCSPMAYLRSVRLLRAREILSSSASDTSVSAIAAKCGFVSPSHFAKKYVGRFGESPSATLKRGKKGVYARKR